MIDIIDKSESVYSHHRLLRILRYYVSARLDLIQQLGDRKVVNFLQAVEFWRSGRSLANINTAIGMVGFFLLVRHPWGLREQCTTVDIVVGVSHF